MSYRIITDGTHYKVQRRGMLWAWTDEGRWDSQTPIGMYDEPIHNFTPYLFNTVAEAEAHVQERITKATRDYPARWRVVKIIHK